MGEPLYHIRGRKIDRKVIEHIDRQIDAAIHAHGSLAWMSGLRRSAVPDRYHY